MGRTMERERGKWKSMKAWKKVVAVSVCAVAAVVVVAAIGIANQKNYVVLCTGLGDEETGAVYQALAEMKVDVKVSPGNTVMVPEDMLEEIKMDIQAEGLLESQSGAETSQLYLDNAVSFGATDEEKERVFRFQQQQNLANTINGMVKIESSIVFIDPPGNDGGGMAHAYVSVEPKKGETITAEDANLIRELVAGAIEGLTVDDITVVNQATEETWGADTAA